MGAPISQNADKDIRKALTNIDINSRISKHVRQLIETGNLIAQNGASQKAALSTLDDTGFEALSPSAATLSGVLTKYAKDNLGNFDNPRKTLESDVGDMWHSVYMPYMDIFRADGYFANLLRERAEKLGVRLVDKLTSLPDAIEDILTKQ